MKPTFTPKVTAELSKGNTVKVNHSDNAVPFMVVVSYEEKLLVLPLSQWKLKNHELTIDLWDKNHIQHGTLVVDVYFHRKYLNHSVIKRDSQ